jgi:hypothetical protein
MALPSRQGKSPQVGQHSDSFSGRAVIPARGAA